MTLLDNRLPPPVLLVVVGALMGAIAQLTSALDTTPLVHYGTTFVLAMLGFAVNAAGFRTIRRAGSTIDPTRPSATSALVVEGPFRATRNPMYVGFVLMLLAWAAFLRSPWALTGPVFFVVYLTRFQIEPEERALRAKFGNSFEDYAARVRRWL